MPKAVCVPLPGRSEAAKSKFAQLRRLQKLRILYTSKQTHRLKGAKNMDMTYTMKDGCRLPDLLPPQFVDWDELDMSRNEPVVRQPLRVARRVA